jgi:hypothetical protein
MKGAHHKQARVRFDGKWAMNFLLIAGATAVVMLYANIWIMFGGVGFFWLVAWGASYIRRSCLDGCEKSILDDTENTVVKEVLKPVEQTHTPRTLLKQPHVNKTAGGPKRPKKKRSGLDSTDTHETPDNHQELSASSISDIGAEILQGCSPRSPPDETAADVSRRHDADDTATANAVLLGPTEADRTASAQKRWQPPPPQSAPAPPCGEVILPAQIPPIQRSDGVEEHATCKSEVREDTVAAPRGALERELLKLEKKAREVKKLQERQTNGEALEQNQLDKIVRGKEIQAWIERIRIQLAVMEHVNTMFSENSQSSEQPLGLVAAPPGLLPSSGACANEGVDGNLPPPPGLDAEELGPPPGLVVEQPPPGLAVQEPSPPLVADEPPPGLVVEEPPSTWPIEALPEELEWDETWEQPSSIAEAWDSVAACNAAYWEWAVAAGYNTSWDASACWWEPVHAEAWEYSSMTPYAFAKQAPRKDLKTRAPRGGPHQSFIDPRELLKRSSSPKEEVDPDVEKETWWM